MRDSSCHVLLLLVHVRRMCMAYALVSGATCVVHVVLCDAIYVLIPRHMYIHHAMHSPIKSIKRGWGLEKLAIDVRRQHHVMSCRVVLASCSCRVVSCRVMSSYVMSCHVMSCRVVSCDHVMTCDVSHVSLLSWAHPACFVCHAHAHVPRSVVFVSSLVIGCMPMKMVS